MLAPLRPVIVSLGCLTILTGAVYPLLTLVLAEALFPEQAHGSLLRRDGKIVGSTLIGQEFSQEIYFWGRPSSTSPAYNAAASSGSNLGPLNPALQAAVQSRCEALAKAHASMPAIIPLDLVTTSGSGLDPHISVAAAEYQLERVASARGMDPAQLRELVSRFIEEPTFGFLGQRRVNVLMLNLELDQIKNL